MKNIFERIKKIFNKLTNTDQAKLLIQLHDEQKKSEHNIFSQKRKDGLENRIFGCPHCESSDFRKHGKDKGSQRYYCKKCKRTFTEYTGTFLAHIHKKDLMIDYIEHIEFETSLNKITELIDISLPTSLAWRHKIMSSLENNQKLKFTGITESDETFFAYSQKGTQLTRPARKRGGEIKKKGISNEQIAVLTTLDRQFEKDLTVTNAGRIRKKDIERVLKGRINKQTILCTDEHVSYKGFATSHKIEHHTIKASTKEYVREKVFHIQTVNSLHSRLKSWINNKFKGVSTKYLQKYMNWFRFKEMYKKSESIKEDLIEQIIQDAGTWLRYKSTVDFVIH